MGHRRLSIVSCPLYHLPVLPFFALLLGIVVLAALSRRAKQRAAVQGLRSQFPPIAREKLAAAFPPLAELLSQQQLAATFDWILTEMFRRTRSRDFAMLMRWAVENGLQVGTLTSEVARAAVDRFPAQLLDEIDRHSHGRTLAGGLLDSALSQAGTRIGPELNRKYV